MAGMFVVTGKKGAVCRRGEELDSERICDVAKGDVVYALEQRQSSCGAARVHIAFPLSGWVSLKVLGKWSSAGPHKRGKAESRAGGGLGYVLGEAARTSEARWDAQEACANAGGFVGVYLTNSEYRFVRPRGGGDAWVDAYLGRGPRGSDLIPTKDSYDAPAVAEALAASTATPRLWMLSHGAPLGLGPLLEQFDAGGADEEEDPRPLNFN